MAAATLKSYPLVLGLVVLFCFARPTLAFGAGNIANLSKVEGVNWRHGDIEDALLSLVMARAAGGKKFDKMMVSRVYFGNWLRDYSQAIDVGTVKAVSAEAIRLLLCILGFMTFGYGSGEFEVTADRLGCYRPEDHIDNPKNYADNMDATQYDRRLRGPVDEGVELAIDPETGLKNYIANEGANIMTSALHVRRLFSKCIELGRSYQQSRDKAELYEALRLMGTGLHCLEDFLAHSNYTELALIEMGERDVFPHVGSSTRMQIPGARDEVYPCVTGTFGGVDFLHSVTGEVSDKLTQNEIQELEGTLQNSQKTDTSFLRNLLDKIPDGILGGDDKKQKMDDIQQNANNAQMESTSISPREPEEFTRYVQQVFQQVMPAIEFHDDLMKKISAALEKVPILPDVIEQLEDQLSMFVFSITAPFVVPLIDQIKNELATGSSEVIQSSKNEQFIVFEDDRSTDPTHSMLSKDHFSNILNEIAGQTASKVVGWVVPQLMEAWDDDNTDVDRMLNRIIYGVMHHPAQRDMGEDGARDGRQLMFRSVEQWWQNMNDGQRDEYRRKLSREGVQNGENHKEGVQDCGHGCGKPLGMHKNFGVGSADNSTMEGRITNQITTAIAGGVAEQFGSVLNNATGGEFGREEESKGGLGGLIGSVASGLLGGFKKEETESYESSGRTNDGGYTETTTQYGRSGDRYGEAQQTETRYGDGRQETSSYSRYEESSRPAYGGGSSYERREEMTSSSSFGHQESSYGGGYGGGRQEERSYGGGREESSYGGGYGGGRQEESYGSRRDDDDDEDKHGRRHQRKDSNDSSREKHHRRKDSNDSGEEEDKKDKHSHLHKRKDSDGGRRDEDEYGGRQESYGGGGGYGREESYGRRDESGYGGRQEGSYGGGYYS